MENIMWIAQGFLALVFLYSGIMKSTQERNKLVSIGQTGVAELSYPVIRTIGAAEILGSAGIILPRALHIAPVLTPVTAICFAIIMCLAAPIHFRRGEMKSVAFNIFLLLLSGWVAWYRFSELGSAQ